MRRRPPETHDPLTLCARAGEAVIKVGFERRDVSMKSEAVYYGWPGRGGLLRIASHAHNPRDSAEPPARILSALTFAPTQPNGTVLLSEGKINEMIARAIGLYMLRSAAIPPLRSARDYRSALAEAETLMDARPGTARGARLEALVAAIETWEARWVALPEGPPDG